MAITQTGSTLTYPVSDTANTGTVSSSITVPSDAEIVIVGVAAYQGTNYGLEALTFTKGGSDTAMVKVAAPVDFSSNWQSAVFWMLAPDTGASKTLKWNWISTGTSGDSDLLFSVTFWKGVDTTDPIRDFQAVQKASFPMTTPTLRAQSGDLIVVWVGGYTGGSEGSVNSWTNATLLANLTHQGDSDGAWATASPSGNTTVTAATVTGFSEGGITGVVLKPPSSPSGIYQVGPILTYQPTVSANANTGTVAADIYVPSNAQIVVVGVAGYQGTTAGLDAMTFTKGGTDTAMTKVTGADSSSNWNAAIFYLNAPDTGPGKTLKWDWISTGTSADAYWMYSVTFWAGIDTSSPVRSSGSSQGSGFPRTTGTLTAVSGDKIVAWYGGYEGGVEGSIDSWTNLTELANVAVRVVSINQSDGAWATGSPSGNTTVSAASATSFSEGGLCAIVLKPASAVAYTLSASGGTYSVTGTDATTRHGWRLDATTGGSYALTGSVASLVYSSAYPVFRAVANTTFASRTGSTAVSKPTGTVDGDVMVMAFFIQTALQGDLVVDAVPTGWFPVGTPTDVNSGSAFGRVYIYWRRALSEGATYTFSHTKTLSTQAAIASYSGCIASGPAVDVYSQNAANSGTTATALSVSIGLPLTKLIYTGHSWTSGGGRSPPTGMTERLDSIVYLADEDRAAIGASGTRTQSLTPSNPWQTYLIALKSVGIASPYAPPPINPAAFLPFLVR